MTSLRKSKLRFSEENQYKSLRREIKGPKQSSRRLFWMRRPNRWRGARAGKMGNKLKLRTWQGSNRGNERSENTKLHSPLRLTGTVTLIRKESQSGQPDNYLTFELVKLQVNKYLPILTFTDATRYYGCSQNFSQ